MQCFAESTARPTWFLKRFDAGKRNLGGNNRVQSLSEIAVGRTPGPRGSPWTRPSSDQGTTTQQEMPTYLRTSTRWWTAAVVCGVLPFQAAARTALEDARDRQDGAALDRSIVELRAASTNGQPQALYQLATAYSYAAEVAIEVKDKAKAETLAESGIDAIKNALRTRENSSEYHRLLGELCGQVIPANPIAGALKYGSCARDEINKALELDSKNALAYVSRGVGNYYLPAALGGSLDAAVKDFDAAIALNPQLDEAYLWKGIALRKNKQLAAARTALETAWKLNPNRIWIKQQLDKTPAN
jgi:tetratricopeptide (TPR) repeat protein